MPRLPNCLIRHARAIDRLIPFLLRPCRNLDSARNELRWLKDAVSLRHRGRSDTAERRWQHNPAPQTTLPHLVQQRGRGVPLQYLLGTEFFGDLELRVRRGVLIPRPETAAAVTKLANNLCIRLPRLCGRNASKEAPEPLKILDLCTGSGCMAILFSYLLRVLLPGMPLRVLGVDAAPRAVTLARENLQRVRREHPSLNEPHVHTRFACADVLGGVFPQSLHSAPGDRKTLQQLLSERGEAQWDVVLANPPYVSQSEYFSARTERSVRCFEPRLALLPQAQQDSWQLPTSSGSVPFEARPEDRFYGPIWKIAKNTGARAVLMEVGGLDQATRVASIAVDRAWGGVEIWRDDPATDHTDVVPTGQSEVMVRGTGEGRSVVAWK